MGKVQNAALMVNLCDYDSQNSQVNVTTTNIRSSSSVSSQTTSVDSSNFDNQIIQSLKTQLEELSVELASAKHQNDNLTKKLNFKEKTIAKKTEQFTHLEDLKKKIENKLNLRIKSLEKQLSDSEC